MSKKPHNFRNNLVHSLIGKYTAKAGLKYADVVQECFNNWNIVESDVIKNFLEFKSVAKSEILKVTTKSENELGKLKSGGSCKTDLVVEVELINKSKIILCISLKKTSSRRVSVHEYSADEFIKVLNISSLKIKNILNKFQNDGSAKNFLAQEKADLIAFFTVQENKMNLYKWVYLGIGGSGTGYQIANCILKNDQFFSLESYIATFMNNKKGGFGTGFAWTRQSRGIGKTIQLKG